MSPTQRIILNIIATYGRSFFALICGIFSSRWLLMSLGTTDYGLFVLVGGLTAFIAIVNSLLGGAIGRYYALSIGEAQKRDCSADGLLNCQGWFTVAMVIHTVIPCVLLIVGYPIGIYLVNNWLEIPQSRIVECVWVWRFACISCFIGMVNVPFTAMYVAKQYIAELTIYSVLQTICNFSLLAYMVLHPNDWLVIYAGLTCAVFVVPQVVICIRASCIFDECRFVWSMCANFSRFKNLFSYCVWQAFGTFAGIARGQGIAILVNKYFYANVNASFALANTVNQHSSSLVSAMQGAFTPAITTAFGSGDIKLAHSLSYRACKFGLLLALLFVLPLSIELPEVLRIWLENPPPYTMGLCWCMFFMLLADKSTLGHMIAVNASGKIALYQTVLGGALLLALPLAWIAVAYGCGVYSIAVALAVTMLICSLGRVIMARSRTGLSMRFWVQHIIFPIIGVTLTSGLVGIIPTLIMEPSLIRILITTICIELFFIPLSWHFVLSHTERGYVADKISLILKKLRGTHG